MGVVPNPVAPSDLMVSPVDSPSNPPLLKAHDACDGEVEVTLTEVRAYVNEF